MEGTVFYKRLDAYRFIAVSFVMVSHWLNFLKAYVNFVLSGFLITNSLLTALQQQPDKRKIAIVFYVRRFLRIFPLYYLVIVLFYVVFKDAVLKKDIAYYLFYGVNLLVLKLQHWPDHFSHFWSLSVEEQFYVCWPIIIIPFFTVRSTLIKLILIAALLSFYLLLTFKKYNNEFFLMNSFYSSLAIVAGAFLSWCWNFRKVWLLKMRLISTFPVMLGLLSVLFFFRQSQYFYLLFLLLSIGNGILLILYLIGNENGERLYVDSFWTNKGIGYLGKISYGIYVYHNFMYHLFAMAGFDRNALTDWSSKGYVIFFIVYPFFYFVVTIIISVLSWELFERPINNLKRYFPYR